MTPDQKEAFRREVLEEAAKVCEELDTTEGAWGEVRLGAYFCASRIRALAASHPAPAADTGQAVAGKSRNQVINRCSYDLAQLVQSHSPDQTSLNNLVWDRLQAMACEIEAAHPAPLDAERVREDERDRLMVAAQKLEVEGIDAHEEDEGFYAVLFLRRHEAMPPAERAALRQKEGEA